MLVNVRIQWLLVLFSREQKRRGKKTDWNMWDAPPWLNISFTLSIRRFVAGSIPCNSFNWNGFCLYLFWNTFIGQWTKLVSRYNNSSKRFWWTLSGLYSLSSTYWSTIPTWVVSITTMCSIIMQKTKPHISFFGLVRTVVRLSRKLFERSL